jgi:pimeloyl-ACP methyl ester carboxylesterase
MNNADNEIVLPDGRRLAYAEFGKPEGFPVMYFHGSPSSRLEPLLIGDSVWSRLGLRIIAPDRPGIGRSDFQPNRGLVHWPQDMIALSDALGLAKFAALGNSGGAPYVAACAAMTPEQLTSAVIVSGGWRMDWPEAQEKLPFANRLLMALASKSQFLAQILLKSMAAFAGGAREKELAQLKKGFHRQTMLPLKRREESKR